MGLASKIASKVTKKFKDKIAGGDLSEFKGSKKAKEALKIKQKETDTALKIANSSVPRTSSAKDKLWQPGENIPTPFDISKTKPGSKQRASVIKASKEADMNKQGHVNIGGKGVNRADVPQHQEILRERQNYKSKKMQEHKSKPEYKAKKQAEHTATLDSAKDQTVTLKPFSPKENEASRVSKMSSGAKTKYHKRMKKIDSQLPF